MELSTFEEKNLTTRVVDFSPYPGFPFVFNFERFLMLHMDGLKHFVREHYFLPFGLSALYYFAIVVLLRRWMQPKQPYNLRTALLYWNYFLALFSILGTIRVVPELIYFVRNHGWFRSICDGRYTDDPRLFAWFYLFAFSKIFEFGDTVFIVLRKQRLLTLHWVHHILTLIYAWFMMYDLTSNSRWLCSMNFAIHSIMYSYYGSMASGTRVRKSIASLITLLQIVQMVLGVGMETVTLWFPQTVCYKPTELSYFGLAMYFLFLILFAKFYYDKYILKKFDTPKKVKTN